MTEWIPLLQSLVWPIVLVLVLLRLKEPLSNLLKAIQERIVAGAEFEAGATGIRFGAAPKLAELPSAQKTNITANAGETANALEAVGAGEMGTTGEMANAGETANTGELAKPDKPPPGIPTPDGIYLVHTARRDTKLDKSDAAYYRVRIYLDADDPSVLDHVSEVVYFLHDTFKDPVRVVRDRQTSFEVRTLVWGEFNVAANVIFEDGNVVKLERYLNL